MESCCITTDKELIKSILNHPSIHRMSSDDCSPKIHEPVIHPAIMYLTNKDHTGIVRIDPMNGICCQAHIGLLPKAYGRGSEFIKEAISFGFTNTRYMKIVAIIPAYNRLTIKVVAKNGFTKEGILRKSFLKNWKMWDQEVWGLTKNEFIYNKGVK